MSDNVVPFRRRLPRIGDGDGGADAYNKQLEGQLEAIGAGGVEPLRKPAAQAVHPENIRDGSPYDNPEFEQLARDMGVWGTAQSAVCAQFWLAATQPAAQGIEKDAARWRMTALISRETMIHPDKRTAADAVAAYMHAVHSGLDIQGAIDAAIAAKAKE